MRAMLAQVHVARTAELERLVRLAVTLLVVPDLGDHEDVFARDRGIADRAAHVRRERVEAVDPLLKTVSGYERKLAPTVSHALGYCETLAADVPGPIEISPRAFSADSLVHALFAAPGDIGDMLCKSRELREFLADPAQCEGDEFFALLGMRRREKAVMGVALHGDGVQNDVPQRLLYFADHTLGEIGGDCEMTRRRLQAAAFDGLVQGFAASVADLRQERTDARTAWNMEQATTGRDERRQALEERQRQATAALAPERLLDAFAEWLAAPEGRLYLKPTEVMVDRMGVIADHPDLTDIDVYAAGSMALMGAAQKVLVAAGLPPEQLFVGYAR